MMLFARMMIREWDVLTPHTDAYDVFLDRHGELWNASMASDRVLRFDPDTGGAIEYLLPRPTNVRRIFVDDTAHAGDLDRQQPRRLDHPGRAARLSAWSVLSYAGARSGRAPSTEQGTSHPNRNARDQ